MLVVVELGGQEYLGAWYAGSLDTLTDLLLVILTRCEQKDFSS